MQLTKKQNYSKMWFTLSHYLKIITHSIAYAMSINLFLQDYLKNFVLLPIPTVSVELLFLWFFFLPQKNFMVQHYYFWSGLALFLCSIMVSIIKIIIFLFWQFLTTMCKTHTMGSKRIPCAWCRYFCRCKEQVERHIISVITLSFSLLWGHLFLLHLALLFVLY